MCGAARACSTSIATFASICAARCYPQYFLLLLLRFNSYTFVQTNCYDQCCKLFKELAAHELKYDFDVVDQNYVILIQVVLGLPPTAATLHTLTCEQVMEMVMVVAEEFDE